MSPFAPNVRWIQQQQHVATARAWRRLQAREETRANRPLTGATAFRIGVSALALALSGLVFMYANYTRIKHAYPWETFWKPRIDAVIRPLLLDRNDRVIGLLLPTPSEDLGAIDPMNDLGAWSELPPVYTATVVRLEDQRLAKSALHICGIDFIALPNIVLMRRGASTLAMQTASLLTDLKKGENGSRLAKIARKLFELGAACVISTSLHAEDDPGSLIELYSATAPFGKGNGGTTRGLVAGADLFFGKRPSELGPGALAFLAACPRSPLVAGSTRPEHLAAYEAVKQRAKNGLIAVYGISSPTAQQGIQELDEMPVDAVPTRTRMEGEPLHLVSRAVATLPSALSLVSEELRGQGSEEVSAVRTSFDLTRLHATRKHVRDALRSMTQRLGVSGRLCLSLLPGTTIRPTACTAEEPAIVNVIAAIDGELTALESSYPGSVARTQQIGSLGKIVAAALRVAQGDTAASSYCRRRVPGIRNADGFEGVDDCAHLGALTTARDAFARSDSLAFIDALRALPDLKVAEAIDALGFKLPNGVSPRVALVLGMVEATDLQMVDLIGAAAAVATDQPDMNAVHTVLAVRTKNEQSKARVVTSRAYSWLRSTLKSQREKKDFALLLSAPVDNANGTMHKLRNRLLTAAGTGPLFCKTGTTDAVNGKHHVGNAGKLIACAFVKNHATHAFVMTVRSPRPSLAVGRELSANDFEPLLTALAPSWSQP